MRTKATFVHAVLLLAVILCSLLLRSMARDWAIYQTRQKEAGTRLRTVKNEMVMRKRSFKKTFHFSKLEYRDELL